ncbi:MAG: ferritin-like domain-containing protein [Sphingomonas sp.]|uniref:ferritin-like domain-containing protein n=1 Tax=Sphingomonas sp. TaxID=28214 RepID=UPI001790B7AE|nr:ferritin-like domain-containing protein [Sphingomonas sp.]MBA3666527.1 ferritin-like domain-containing protein [Sphingomonas sp.]
MEQIGQDRRSLFGLSNGQAALAAVGVLAASTAFPLNEAVAQQAESSTDVDLFNFALNLEYLETDYYLRGLGTTVDVVFRTSFGAPVKGGRKVQFSNPVREGMIKNIAGNEVAHINFVRAITGSQASKRPPIDMDAGFAAVAAAAGLSDFDPFGNEMDFFLGGMLFEDVGISVLKGSARKLRSLTLRESAAGLLGSEGYHMGAIRSVIYKMGDTWRSRAAAISEFRDRLDGPQDLDQPPVKVGALANITPTNQNGIAFGRTPQHALNIIYGNPAQGIMAGGFFPEGFNGRIRST